MIWTVAYALVAVIAWYPLAVRIAKWDGSTDGAQWVAGVFFGGLAALFWLPILAGGTLFWASRWVSRWFTANHPRADL